MQKHWQPQPVAWPANAVADAAAQPAADVPAPGPAAPPVQRPYKIRKQAHAKYTKAWIRMQNIARGVEDESGESESDSADEQEQPPAPVAERMDAAAAAAAAATAMQSPRMLELLLRQFRRRHQLHYSLLSARADASDVRSFIDLQQHRKREREARTTEKQLPPQHQQLIASTATELTVQRHPQQLTSPLTVGSVTSVPLALVAEAESHAPDSRKKQKMVQGAATIAGAAVAVSSSGLTPNSSLPAHQISISVQLIMQYLPLMDVESAGQVCRVWRSASASPLVWSEGRHDRLVVFDQAPWLQLYPDESEHVKLEQVLRSRLYRNIQTLELDGSASLETLNQLHALPGLTRVSLKSNKFRFLLRLGLHPLLRRMRSVKLTLNWSPQNKGYHRIGQILGLCGQLRKLQIKISLRNLPSDAFDSLLLLINPAQIEWLSALTFFIPTACLTRVSCWSNLHTLDANLTTRQVEIMCERSTAERWTALHTLGLGLERLGEHEQEQDRSAEEQAAASFGGLLTTRELQLCRLACLSRLPTLRHLRVEFDGCITGNAMLPLRLAQQRDATAFTQLQSCSFINSKQPCIAVPGRGLPPSTHVLSFPSLTTLRIGCCTHDLPDSPSELAQLCAETPNLRDLAFDFHAKESSNTCIPPDALRWCRLPALHSLTRLHTLRVHHGVWRADRMTTDMLLDLYTLTSLPELNFFELTPVCQLRSRAELCNVLMLEEVQEFDSESGSELDSDYEYDSKYE